VNPTRRREKDVVHHELGINVTGLDETRRLIGDEDTIALVREKFRWAAEEIIRTIRQGSLLTHRAVDEGGRELITIVKMPATPRVTRDDASPMLDQEQRARLRKEVAHGHSTRASSTPRG
jgi:hypothetical protein